MIYCGFCFFTIIENNICILFFYHIFVPYLCRNLINDEVKLMSTYEYL